MYWWSIAATLPPNETSTRFRGPDRRHARLWQSCKKHIRTTTTFPIVNRRRPECAVSDVRLSKAPSRPKAQQKLVVAGGFRLDLFELWPDLFGGNRSLFEVGNQRHTRVK